MKARIYQPAKTTMQSGQAKSSYWLLEFAPNHEKTPDPLMGWNSSSDTSEQLQLRFPTLDAAVKYAENKGIIYDLRMPNGRGSQPNVYASNFSYYRIRT